MTAESISPCLLLHTNSNTHKSNSLGYTVYCYGHILYTKPHMIPLPPLPESRVSLQPLVSAPDARSYGLPTFPDSQSSTGGGPNPTNATQRPGNAAKGHPGLAKSIYS